ncbi:uncharacterized protein LOC127137391 [Lathyrus oleraceus]|uniref:uncharacterized protein LOC127137391 n=1 Tax=Pisum sativum TaxID=3888 RepID=UPI0021D3E8C9|nr:uncharacterized protein LOC127137391 [Pisum sativum]
MVELDDGRKLITSVSELKTLLIEIKNVLIRSDAFPVCTKTCEHCLTDPPQCEILKAFIQTLVNQGILLIDLPSTIKDVSTLEIPYDEVPPLQIPYNLSQLTLSTNPIAPMVITVPTSFPYDDTKEVPWVYDTSVYIHGQKMQEETMKSNDPIVSIVGTGEVTRSGRIFAPVPPSIGPSGPSILNKAKQIDDTQQRQDSLPTNEVDEFLRIIKRSDYRVVEQLNQTPSKISMFSLLMCSEAHRDALVKFLKTAHVPQEISVCQFEGVVNSIVVSQSLGFSDEELPAEGKNHNKALHVSIECMDTVLSRVLVDTGSSFNVMLKGSLTKLTIEGLVMKPSELVVRAFDGSRRTAIGEVNLPMKIVPHTFFITFFVMDIHPTYSCILGRLWIHSVGVVTSALH